MAFLLPQPFLLRMMIAILESKAPVSAMRQSQSKSGLEKACDRRISFFLLSYIGSF